jgi:hypothetical protein
MVAWNGSAMIGPVNDLHEGPQTERPPIAVRLAAWRRYLEDTRAATGEAYVLVEERAWQRMASKLHRDRPAGLRN